MNIISELVHKSTSKLEIEKIKELVTFMNPASYVIARNHIDIFKQFHLLFLDGWLLVFLTRMIGIKTKRFSFDMTSVAPKLFNFCIENNKTIYFIGSDNKSVTGFINILKKSFPELITLGYRNGYFSDSNERRKCIEDIMHINPDYVIVGMGTPLQEQFLIDLKNIGWLGVGFTCGGFIHQTSNKLYYYPKWVNKYNLRMPYRLIAEKDFRKKIKLYIQFPIVFANDFVKYKAKRR